MLKHKKVELAVCLRDIYNNIFRKAAATTSPSKKEKKGERNKQTNKKQYFSIKGFYYICSKFILFKIFHLLEMNVLYKVV